MNESTANQPPTVEIVTNSVNDVTEVTIRCNGIVLKLITQQGQKRPRSPKVQNHAKPPRRMPTHYLSRGGSKFVREKWNTMMLSGWTMHKGIDAGCADAPWQTMYTCTSQSDAEKFWNFAHFRGWDAEIWKQPDTDEWVLLSSR